MAIDLAACVGCAACAVACKLENEVPAGVQRLWIRLEEGGAFPNPSAWFRPEQCQHCSEPACVAVCPTGASYVGEWGLVLVEAETCIACGACVAACPYDARHFDPRGFVSKCSFCDHRVAEGRPPACVETCPTLCRTFGDLDDPSSEVAIAVAEARRIDVMKPEVGTHPNVYYLNAPRPFCSEVVAARARGTGGEARR
jgi:Fe-S-cluster-containing dehydrogenase component